METGLFEVCSADPGVSALLGAGLECRLYIFGKAPKDVALPYAVSRQVFGQPENYLGDLPDRDDFVVQIDVYSNSGSSAHAVAKALRDAIEPHAYINAWRGESRDPETKHYNYSFDVDWNVNR